MHHNPAFSQALIIPRGAHRMLIGGQNSVAKDGNVVFQRDLGAQTTKALENMALCIAAPTSWSKSTVSRYCPDSPFASPARDAYIGGARKGYGDKWLS